jgi:glycosyltransferase involved in cell wall biosynthesis
MKVCILTHDFPPGQGAALRYIGDLVDELLKFKIKIVVITLAANQNVPLFEKKNNLTIYRFRPRLRPYLWNFEFMLRLKPILEYVYKKEIFDLLHSEHIFPVFAAGIFSKKYKIPHIVVIEGITKYTPYSKIVCLIHRLILPKSHYDILVSWSKFIIDEYFRKWGMKIKNIEIIPGAVDTKKFNPFVKRKKMKLVSKNEKLIFIAKPLYASNAIGIATAIRAMKEVLKKEKNCKLIVAGEGRKRKSLEELIRNLHLEENVKFIGWVRQSEIPNYYAAADVVIDPINFRHPGSITVLESLTSGKPLVITRTECLPGERNIPNNKISVVVKHSDYEDMARGILKLLKNRKLGQKIGKNAWIFVRNNFSMEKIARKYKKLYEKILNQ